MEPPPAPIDVAVKGEPRAPGNVALSAGEIRALPGAFGDAFRAIEAMPGVTPMLSGSPYFYVRGAPPGNVGYFVDGIRVPALYHILVGPAVLPSSMIQRVELFPGGYPAEYGRFAGGIVAGEVRPPAVELRAEATLRLIDAGALVEAPLPDGLGSALAAARYSYTAPVLSLFAPDLQLEYWDYQGRVALNLSPTQRLTVFAFGSHDYLGKRPPPELSELPSTTLYGSDFHRVDVRYDAELGDRTRLEQALTFGLDSSTVALPVTLGSITLTSETEARDVMVNARTRITHRLNDSVLLRGGINAEVDAYHVEPLAFPPADVTLFSGRQDIAVGVFADAVLDAGHGVQITPGARVDLWGSQGATALSADVRLAVRAPLTPRVRLLSTAGLAHQGPGFAVPLAGVAIGGLKNGLQKSVQTSAGVEADLPLEITGSATFFYNAFFDLSDPIGMETRDVAPSYQQGDLGWINNRALGSAVGMELYLRRRLTKRLGGFLAYTLSRSTRYAGKHTFAAEFDHTHTLGAALSWDIGHGFRAGARATFYTGTPYSPFAPAADVALVGADRSPPFFRLDVRAEKRFSIGERHFVSIVAEVQNATLSQEAHGISCSSNPARCEPALMSPITLPSLGVEGAL